MAVSQEYLDFVLEMLEPVGPVAARRMFGGAGIFLDGVMFALVTREQLYFRVDDQTRGDFLEQGCEPFMYRTKKGERGLSSYYEAPDHLLDDADEMAEWGRSAADAAFRVRAAKEGKRRS